MKYINLRLHTITKLKPLEKLNAETRSALGESKQNTKVMHSSVTIRSNMPNVKKQNNKIPTGGKKGKLQWNTFENQIKTKVFSCVLFQSAAAALFSQTQNFTFFFVMGKKKDSKSNNKYTSQRYILETL